MTFATDMAAANAEISTEFGAVAGTLTARDGTETAVANGSWLEETDAPTRRERGEDNKREARLVVLTSEVASVERYATFTLTSSGETWTIARVQPMAGANRLTVTRAQSEERAADSYREAIP